MRLLPYGDRALLAEFDSQTEVLGAAHAWQSPPPGVLELVPAARTILVRVDPELLGLGHLEHWLTTTPRGTATLPAGAVVDIPVRYDGDDLGAIADAWGCSVEEAIARHLETEWVCAFIGFSPGFPYLVPASLDALPPIARRATSRPAVPAGAVALAAEYCGIYPRSSPGGWQLLGSTTTALWDAARAQPALVTPGDRVRFTRVRE